MEYKEQADTKHNRKSLRAERKGFEDKNKEKEREKFMQKEHFKKFFLFYLTLI